MIKRPEFFSWKELIKLICLLIIFHFGFSTFEIKANSIDSLKQVLEGGDLTIADKLKTQRRLITTMKYRGPFVDSLIINALKIADEGNEHLEEARLLKTQNLVNVYKNNFNNHMANVLRIDSLYKFIPDSVEMKYIILTETAYYHWSQQNYNESVTYYKKALAWANENNLKDKIGYLHSSLAHKQGLNNEFYDAINNYHEALKYKNISKAQIYGNMTNLYKRLEDWDNAVHYAKLCHKNALLEDYANALIQSKTNEAIALIELKAYDEGLSILDSLRMDFANPFRQKILSILLAKTFYIYNELEEHDKVISMRHYLDSIEAKTWDYSGMLSEVGKAYLAKSFNKRAEKYCEEGFNIAQNKGTNSHKKNACSCLSKTYENLGKYKEANEMLKTYNLIVEKIDSRAKVMNLSRALNKQELKNQEDYLALAQAQKELLYQSKITQYNIAGGLGFLLFLLAILSASQLRKRNNQIKKQNKLITNALEEKDVLLREIHHRVKNNLQVISSLLSLQSRQIDDHKIKQAISEGRNRVRSMALIHQNLYQQENITGVSVKDYLDKLTSELFDTYNISKDQVKLELDIENIDLDVDTMVPLGLIINELVSNALKHAFPEQLKGRIKVSLIENENGLELIVEDNGIGVSMEKMTESKSFGNRLISAFSKKLKADLNIENDKGTKVRLYIHDFKKVA